MISRETIAKYQYYVFIAILSLFCVIVLPMIGTEVGLAFVLPTTVAGWVVWSISKIAVAALNVMILYCFTEQAKVNIKDDPRYVKAKQLMLELTEDRLHQPRSPERYFGGMYSKKGAGLVIATLASLIGLGQAVLTFDIIVFFTYLFTITVAIIFSWFQMKETETYWTEEYYTYVLQYIKSLKEKEKQNEKLSNPEPGTASSEECE